MVKRQLLFGLIAVIFLISTIVTYSQAIHQEENNTQIIEVTTTESEAPTIKPQNTIIPVSMDMPTPKDTTAKIPDIIPETGETFQQPATRPVLKQFEINKDHDIWYAQHPESYITPDNEWVKYLASQLYINQEDGRIKYKNKPVPWVVNEKGIVVKWTDEPLFLNYTPDDDQFNYPANGDLWVNADYYISNDLKGDCEDWAIATTSMMLSGEMSIKENGTYVRQTIPAKVVIGYAGDVKHAWTEYNVTGTNYITSIGRIISNPLDTQITYSSTLAYYPYGSSWDKFTPIYEFTDLHFNKYSSKAGR